VGNPRLGVFGGTFDPPHIGHLILASEAVDQLGLERVLWVVTQAPPHKQDMSITPLAQRLAMVAACIGDDPKFEISRVEIDRPVPHYAVDTMKILQRKHPGYALVYLMGGDSLNNLPTWYHPKQFVHTCHTIGVMKRPGTHIDLKQLEAVLPGIASKVNFIQAPLLDIAASQIRRRVRESRAYRYFLPPAVYGLIEEWGLYHVMKQIG
jgi:nicotinate-nucleotide adenylyltransferase